MRLNHIDLLVTDVQHSAQFYCERFGMSVVSNPSSPAILVLSDGGGFVLVLQRAEEPGVSYPKGFHIGFLVESEDKVRALHARAREAGAEVSDVIVNGRGTLTYFTAPDGYVVEVSCQNERLRAQHGH